MLTSEDLEIIKECFSIAEMEPYIVGKKVYHPVYGKGTVVSCENKFLTIQIDFNGEICAMGFPYAFINMVKFDDEVLNEYVTSKVNIFEIALEMGATYEVPSFLYSLSLFRMVQNTATSRKESFELLYRAAKAGDDTAQECLLGACSRRIEDGGSVDDEIALFAVNLMKDQERKGNRLASSLLADYYYVTRNYKMAERYLKKIAENRDLFNDEKGEDVALLAGMYYTGKRGDSIDKSVFCNYQLAKKYFEIAAKCGYDCEADMAYVNRALGIEAPNNEMKKMAQKTIVENYSSIETYNFILSSLRNEFGNLWSVLPASSQIDLVSGCVVYCNLYALGEAICGDIDFSAAIIPIVKAAEVVFRQYLCYGYYDYLLEHKTSPETFPPSHPFVEYDNRNRIYKFKAKESIVFTLGSMKWIVYDSHRRDVYPDFFAYANELMGKHMESRSVLKDYLIKLSKKMTQFTFDIRNPAAHSEIMPLWQAEICGNEIILVKKILKDFIAKLA